MARPVRVFGRRIVAMPGPDGGDARRGNGARDEHISFQSSLGTPCSRATHVQQDNALDAIGERLALC